MSTIQILSFPVNNWGHLYSLQQAISHNAQLTGSKLSITGRILKPPFLQNIDTPVSIDFIQVAQTPDYPLLNSGSHELGTMLFSKQQLTTEIAIDSRVFEELRKNLMEYTDIEGIHIMITLGLLSTAEHWQQDETLQIVQLDYAMKGDS